MKKVKLNDVTLNNGRDIEANSSVKILSHKEFAPLDEEIQEVEQKNKRGNFFKFLGFFILAVFLFLYIGHAFSRATVEIKRVRVPFQFSNQVVIANESPNSELPFTVVEVTDTHHESVIPDLLNSSAQKATGSAVIYNSYTKSKINLKKGSVFTAKNNIKFVSTGAVVIPGYTVDADKKIIPGQVIVNLVADAYGSSSNIGNADLTLYNYRNNSSKIYARTNEVIAGGADKLAYGLSDALKNSISEKIDEALKKSLYIKAGAEIPDEYILYINMFTYNPKSLIISGTPQTLDVSKEASLIAYVIKRKDIEKLIKSKLTLPEPANPQYLGINNLSVKMISAPENLKNPQTLNLNFTGEGQVVSYIDTTELAKSLRKSSIKNAKKTLSSIQNIQNYKISVNPKYMWLMPKNSKRIKIIDVNNN